MRIGMPILALLVAILLVRRQGILDRGVFALLTRGGRA